MFQYPRLLPYKVAHPRDKRLVAHNGGAVYLLSNVPRKPAASRSPRIRPVPMCTCAGPVVFQLLIFTASTNKPGGDEETASFNCSPKSLKTWPTNVYVDNNGCGEERFLPWSLGNRYGIIRWNNLIGLLTFMGRVV